MTQQEKEYLTYAEAAARYKVAEVTVRGWVRAGLIKRFRKPLDKKVYVRASEIDRLKNAEPTEVQEKQEKQEKGSDTE